MKVFQKKYLVKKLNPNLNHAPNRKKILSNKEILLALQNALRYFPSNQHKFLIKEFQEELLNMGRIYMYRYKPSYKIEAKDFNSFPHKCKSAAAIMLMISNNLDHAIAQHPDELITYGGNGSVFQNWAQYRLTMKYLAEMSKRPNISAILWPSIRFIPSNKKRP